MGVTGAPTQLSRNLVVAGEQERHDQCHVEEEAMRVMWREPPSTFYMPNGVGMLPQITVSQTGVTPCEGKVRI